MKNKEKRLILTDPMWDQLKSALGGLGCYITKNTRKNIEGILHRIRAGCPWRDIPHYICDWRVAYAIYNQWSYRGIWNELFLIVRGELDAEWNFIDGSYIKVHQDASGARAGERRDIGKSAGGQTSKIHMSVDAHGNPVNFLLTPGNVHDNKVASELIDLFDAQNVVADKGYDSDKTRDKIKQKNSVPIIPTKANSSRPNPDFDSEIYKHRHLVENFFAKIKRWRGIATRFDKLSRNFKSAFYIACSIIWIKL